MKRICSLILILALVLSCCSALSITVSAVADGTLSTNITWELSSTGVLTISGSGAMPEYSEDDASPFTSMSGIKTAVISEGVTSIGAYTFYGCADLKSATIPASVNNVGYAAFLGCVGLEEIHVDGNSNSFSSADGVLFNKDKTTLVQFPIGKALASYTIPEGVKHIADVAFVFSNNLQSIVFSNTVETMGFASFLGCSNLASVKLSDNLEYIEDSSFALCVSLSDVTIPDSVTDIGYGAFAECENLSAVDLGNGVKEIGDSAFTLCTNLDSVVIPDCVESICADAFSDCENLSEITISDNVKTIGRNAFRNTEYYQNPNNWENDVLYINNHLIKAKSTLSGAYTIKVGTKTIAGEAFSNCTNLTELVIPEGVTSVGVKAFNSCEKLVSIVLPASIKTVGNMAFYNCGNLKYIFYGGTEEEWNSVFIGSGNTPPETAKIHYNSNDHSYSTEIVQNTCSEDGYIKTVCSVCGVGTTEIIPATDHNFSTQWTVDKEPTASDDGEKSRHCFYCEEREDITQIPCNLEMNDIAFVETDGFNENGEITYTVSLKAGVSVLGSVFGVVFDPDVLEPVEDKCGAVGIVDEDDNLINNFNGIYMADMKFGTDDTYIVAHTNTKEISKKRDLGYVQFTFKIKDETAPEASVIINCFEFSGEPSVANNLNGVYLDYFKHEIPSLDDVLTFELNSDGTGYVITDCASDYTGALEIPEKYKNLPVLGIGAEAFRDCEGVTSVIIPDSVVSIGGSAFRSCTALTDIRLSDNITSIPGAMCYGCTSLENITIPEGIVNIGSYAFSGCTSLKEATLPESANNIGGYVFNGCNSLIIYCRINSGAHKYADDNNISYVTCAETTRIDLITKIIYTDVSGGGLENIITTAEDVSCSINSAYAGTGSVIDVVKGGMLYSKYTLVVFGDTNGDSVCDVLDCFQIERAANGNEVISGVYSEAGDVNGDGIIDASDYQSVVNKSLS